MAATPSDPRVVIQACMQQASNYNHWIAAQARTHVGRRVLDAGCGSGNLAAELLDRDLVVGVEVWDDFVDLLEHRFGECANVRIHQFDLTDPSMVGAMGKYQLDSAMCSNVLEHVEDDAAALANIAAVLPPGAPIFVLVPAFMAIYGAHDRADHHVRRYTKRLLANTLAELPIRIERQYYMNLPGFFAWFLLGRVVRKPLRESDVGAYDRLVPVIQAIEQRVRPPLGQSLVAFLRTTR